MVKALNLIPRVFGTKTLFALTIVNVLVLLVGMYGRGNALEEYKAQVVEIGHSECTYQTTVGNLVNLLTPGASGLDYYRFKTLLRGLYVCKGVGDDESRGVTPSCDKKGRCA